MKENLKVALVQFNQVWEDKQANFKFLDKLIQESVLTPTDLIIFPEMFHTGFSMNPSGLAETMDGEGIQWLKEKAKEYSAATVASVIIKEGKKFVNRGVFIEPNGIIHQYDKRKLFSLSRENNYFEAGNQPLIIEYKGWKIRLQICYDLRFPEMAENKVENGKFWYDLLINIANWPQKRIFHWKTLLQARAIENQVFVIGVNRVGKNNKGLYYSGDSAIINPDGTTIQSCSDQETVINDELDYSILESTRNLLPFLNDR
ncbi:MAG: nitrilase-related carbon-nitrogen hydrolase [Brumimicrobium sp.]